MIAAHDVPPVTTWTCDWCGRRAVVRGEGIPPGWIVYPVRTGRRRSFAQHQCERCRPYGYAGARPDAAR